MWNEVMKKKWKIKIFLQKKKRRKIFFKEFRNSMISSKYQISDSGSIQNQDLTVAKSEICD